MPTKNNINKIKNFAKSYISKLQFNKGMERKAVENGNYNFSSLVRKKFGGKLNRPPKKIELKTADEIAPAPVIQNEEETNEQKLQRFLDAFMENYDEDDIPRQVVDFMIFRINNMNVNDNALFNFYDDEFTKATLLIYLGDLRETAPVEGSGK